MERGKSFPFLFPLHLNTCYHTYTFAYELHTLSFKEMHEQEIKFSLITQWLHAQHWHNGKHQLPLHALRMEGETRIVHFQYFHHNIHWSSWEFIHIDICCICLSEAQVQVWWYFQPANSSPTPPLMVWLSLLFPGTSNVCHRNLFWPFVSSINVLFLKLF